VLERLEGAGSPAKLDELPLFAAVQERAAPPPGLSKAEAALAAVDPDGMSPREALEALYRLKALAG
jgi:DNA mismatch repair protein MutS